MLDVDTATLGALADAATYADQWLAYRREFHDIPGLVVAMRRDQDSFLSRAYGFAQLESAVAMTPRHVFRVASHSKMFTATAVMQLVEQGRLRLDERASNLLPWLSAEVTIRQLLNHAGGIVRDGAEADHWLTEVEFPDRARLQAIAQHGVVFDANVRFKYSNIGYGLLGLVIESVTGGTYNDYVQQQIVDRLGLVHTGPEVHAGVADRLVTGYSTGRLGIPRRAVPVIETHALSSATGFYSTAEDLCQFASAHWFGNSTLLSDASKREMQHPYWGIEHADEHYGLGFSVRQIGKRQVYGHGGGFPGQSTRTLFDPADRLVVVVLSNTGGQLGAASPIAETIVKIVDFALEGAKERPAGGGGGDQRAPDWPVERFVGRFMNLWGVTDVAAFGNSLVAINPELDDPVLHATKLEVVDQDTLRIAETGGYGSPGEAFRYERDASGATLRVVTGGVSCYPVEVFRERVG